MTKPVGDLHTVRHTDLVRVDQPLVLITQAQRSGGTLLQRLLDGHPQCHVVPFQFRGIDAAIKNRPGSAEEAWKAFYDPKLIDRFERGHRQRKHKVLRDENVYSFRLPPQLQRDAYDACVRDLDEHGLRPLLECYLTAFFNAWLDYGNRGGEKRWVVAFEPAVAKGAARRSRVRRLYPDGRIISIVRDPWSWYASASRWEPRWRDVEPALEHWCRVAEGTIAWKRKVGDDLVVVRFDHLLRRTEETMRGLAQWLDLEFTPGLLEPTFNGQAIAANTSFGDVATGVSAKPLERTQGQFDKATRMHIKRRAAVLHKRLRRYADL